MTRTRLTFILVAVIVLACACWAPAAGALAPAGGAFFWQSPQPFGGDLFGFAFADATHVWGVAGGLAIGADQLAMSTDGGVIWTAVDPHASGSIWGLDFPDALHGRAMSTWYDDAANTDKAALLLTNDGGATWSSREVVQDRFSAGDVGFASADVGWMIGQGWDAATKAWKGTLLATTDAGVTWQRSVLPSHTVDDLTVIDAAHLWMRAGNRAFLTSSDGGATWARHSLATHTYVDDLDPVDGTHAWLLAESPAWGEGDILFRTSDGGVTWAKVGPLGGWASLTAVSQNEAWVSLENWSGSIDQRWLQHTTDGGQTWTRSYAGPNGPGSLTIGPGGVLLGVGAGVWRSPDAGATWLHVVDGGLDFQVNDVCSVGPSELWAVGETTPDAANSWNLGNGSGLLFHSPDGVSWQPVDIPLGMPLSVVSFGDAQHGWIAGQSDDAWRGRLLRTTDAGATWTRCPAADHLMFTDVTARGSQTAVGLATDTEDGDTVVAATSDGGATWSETIRPSAEYLAAIQTPTADHWLVAGSAGSARMLLETTDAGVTWSRRDLDVKPLVRDMTFIDATHGWILTSDSVNFFGLSDGSVILRTADAGVTWQQTDLGHVSSAGLTTLSFSDATHGWAVGDKVLATSDGGVTWQDAGVTVPRSGTMREVPLLSSVACSGVNAWAVGARETILSTLDTSADTTPPVTCDDADGLWHNGDVTVDLRAFDAGSGVARTEYHVDGVPGWTTGHEVTLQALFDHTGDGVHTVSYRSVDAAGNTEVANRCRILIDTTIPETKVRAPHTAARGSSATIRYRVDDATSPEADVTLELQRWVHHTFVVVQRRVVGRVNTGAWQAAKIRYHVPAGTYYWIVQASDLAGNAADEWLLGPSQVTIK